MARIVGQEGFSGLYRGASAIAAGTVVQRGVVMSTYELVYSSKVPELD